MVYKIISENWARRLIFVFLLLIACPVVNLVLGSNNLNDLGFVGIMFIPGFFITLVYLIVSFVLWLFLKRKHKTFLVLDTVIFAILLIVLFLPVPNLHSQLSRHNDEIDEKIRDSIRILNEKIIQSIRNNEPFVMYNLFVEEIRSQGIDSIRNLYSQFAPEIKGETFELYNEYYVVSQNWWPVQFTVLSETVADSEFYMHVNTASNNTYISLLKSKGEFKDFIFSFVYVKINNKWRLHIAYLGIFKIGGKTALEWFQDAQKLSEKGHNVPALLRLSIVNQFLRPAPFIQYAKEKEVVAFSNEIQAKINKKHKFPIHLSNIKNAPEIYYIEPQFVQTDLLPMIKYVTKIPLNNVSELQKEVDVITADLESIFPGMTKGISHIVYGAYPEPPTDPKKEYQGYRLTSEIK